jgi:hypothetical protein
MGRPPAFITGSGVARVWIMAVALFIGAPAAAQNQSTRGSDETLISGAIAPVCTVEVITAEVLVDVSVRAAQTATPITYTCNSVGGITRRVISQNGGSLVRGSQAIPYRLSEEGSSGLAFAPAWLQAPLVTQVASFPQLTRGAQNMLRVSIPAVPPRLVAGEYTDTITIEIAPN